jgi:hypothetical protein
MINDDPHIEARADRIMTLLHIIAHADPEYPRSITAARNAFNRLSNDLGKDAAWTLIARMPRETLLVLAATHVQAA